MATITTSTYGSSNKKLFNPELTTELFNKVKGASTLAKLSGSEPIPFSGLDVFTFSMDGEASIVGEGQNKPAGEAEFGKVTIAPLKVVYQHRLTDEFVHLANEKRLPYMRAFTDGFSKKIARAVDIMGFHGVNPATGTASALIGTNHFDAAVTATVTYDASQPDENIDSAVQVIQTAGGDISGIAMNPAFGAALGAMKASGTGLPIYPDYRFGGNPGNFGGLRADINNTVSFGAASSVASKDRAVIGDFGKAFRWGYAERITFEVIEFGDPDGQGDLKQQNQVCLRSEAYVGWGILNPASFVRITAE
jgi:HK97 family phage major capsid protein